MLKEREMPHRQGKNKAGSEAERASGGASSKASGRASGEASGRTSGNGLSRAKRLLASPAVTMGMFGLAAALLLGSAVGGARAALTYTSDYYRSSVEMYDIGVSLYEKSGNGAPKRVSWRNYDMDQSGYWDDGEHSDGEGNSLLTDLLVLEDGTKEELKLGKKYDEKLYVVNTGAIDQYVRVTLYKYWLDADGKKLPELSPGLIELHLTNCGQEGSWIVDEASSTKERTVLYYRHILKAAGEGVKEEETRSEPLCDYLRIDPSVADKVSREVTEEGDYTTITTTYLYDGAEFRIEAQVDAVQTHSAQDAIRSAWGREAEIDDDGTLISVR